MESNFVERTEVFIEQMNNAIKEEDLVLESSAAHIRILEDRMENARKSKELFQAEANEARQAILDYQRQNPPAHEG